MQKKLVNSVYSVGLVGYGRWGKILSKEIGLHEKLNLVGICYPSTEVENGFFYKTLDEMLEFTNPDSVVIAAPLKNRAELIMKALMADKSVLAEKPIAESSQEAEHLAKIAYSRSLTLHTNYVHAYSQGVEYAIDHLQALGRLELISLTMHQPGPMYSLEGPMSLLGAHGFAIAMRSIEGDSKLIDFNLDLCINSSAGNMSYIEGSLPSSGAALTMNVNIAHPQRQRSIDYILSKGTMSIQLAGSSAGGWICKLPCSDFRDNTIPACTGKQLDETQNIRTVLTGFVDAMKGSKPGNILLAISVQRAIDKCCSKLQ